MARGGQSLSPRQGEEGDDVDDGGDGIPRSRSRSRYRSSAGPEREVLTQEETRPSTREPPPPPPSPTRDLLAHSIPDRYKVEAIIKSIEWTDRDGKPLKRECQNMFRKLWGKEDDSRDSRGGEGGGERSEWGDGSAFPTAAVSPRLPSTSELASFLLLPPSRMVTMICHASSKEQVDRYYRELVPEVSTEGSGLSQHRGGCVDGCSDAISGPGLLEGLIPDKVGCITRGGEGGRGGGGGMDPLLPA